MAKLKTLSNTFRAFISVTTRVFLGKNTRKKIFERLKWHDSGRPIMLGIFYPICRLTRCNKFFLLLPHEKEVARFLFRLKDDVFVDVGANLGFYTTLLCKNFTLVAAIEPNPEDMKMLKENLKPITDNVVFIQKAVSDKNSFADFYFYGRTLSGTVRMSSSISQNDEEGQKNSLRIGKVAKVETITVESLIDYLVKINSLFKNIDLVKVDVEGAEWEVLQGAKNVIKQIRAWLIELHNPSRKNELEDLMASYGYEHRWIDRNHMFAWRN